MAGNKVHAEGLNSKKSKGRTLFGAEIGAKETSKEGQGTLGGRAAGSPHPPPGVSQREGTHVLEGQRADALGSSSRGTVALWVTANARL